MRCKAITRNNKQTKKPNDWRKERRQSGKYLTYKHKLLRSLNWTHSLWEYKITIDGVLSSSKVIQLSVRQIHRRKQFYAGLIYERQWFDLIWSLFALLENEVEENRRGYYYSELLKSYDVSNPIIRIANDASQVQILIFWCYLSFSVQNSDDNS